MSLSFKSWIFCNKFDPIAYYFLGKEDSNVACGILWILEKFVMVRSWKLWENFQRKLIFCKIHQRTRLMSHVLENSCMWVGYKCIATTQLWDCSYKYPLLLNLTIFELNLCFSLGNMMFVINFKCLQINFSVLVAILHWNSLEIIQDLHFWLIVQWHLQSHTQKSLHLIRR